jgi:hypothetical protein
MEQDRVIARAHRGRPLQMALIARLPGAALLSAQGLASLVAADEAIPIGFPIEDVFAFDPDLMAQLKAEWDKGHRPPPG